MSKVTIKNLSPIHCRTGRACLAWRVVDLADVCEQSAPNIRKFEYGGKVSDKAKQAIIDAFEQNGVELLNGNRPGARLMRL